MTDEMEDLKRRLMLRQKSDGRSVYDQAVKSELVALCRQPGASASRLARACGVNTSQVNLHAYLKNVLQRLPTHKVCFVPELLPHR